MIIKLVSTYKLCKENFVFIKIHDDCFFVKGNLTKRILLKGPMIDGSYKFLGAKPNFVVQTRQKTSFFFLLLVQLGMT